MCRVIPRKTSVGPGADQRELNQNAEVETLVQILLLIFASAAMSVVALMIRKFFDGTPPFALAVVVLVLFVTISSVVTVNVVLKARSSVLPPAYETTAQQLPLVVFDQSFRALAVCMVLFAIPVVIAGTTLIRPVSTACAEFIYGLRGASATEDELPLGGEASDEERRVAHAQFPTVKTIESFTFRLQPGLNEALLRELTRGAYLDERKNVIFIGESGTGKTHLAIALGVAACGQGKSVRFYAVNRLAQELLEHAAAGALESFLTNVTGNDLVILDELGYTPVPQEAVPHLVTLVNRLQNHRSVIVTTHLPLENWSQAITDSDHAKVLADTLAKNAEIIATYTETFRGQPTAKLINPVPDNSGETSV